jgi:hypothetical protein
MTNDKREPPLDDQGQVHSDVFNTSLSAEERSYLQLEMMGPFTDEELASFMTDEQRLRYRAWLAQKRKEGADKK